MALNSETKNVVGVINFPIKYTNITYANILSNLKSWLNSHCTEYYFIVHDKDTKKVDDKLVLKTIHIHYCFKSNDTKHRLSWYINAISDALSIDTNLISASVWKDYEGNIQYLIHKNNSEKYLYDSSEIITNMSTETLDLILNRELKVNISIEYLEDVVRGSNGKLCTIYRVLGLEISKQYRSIINDLICAYKNGEIH